MYATCMFCNKPLGTNEVVETFPVGRRLAFDAEKGRLWVVCRKCERWNLSPLEERWEAVEQCERIFRETRIRVSTENIGLAKHPEGLELVRIGEPLRPEFAAWRYGDQFGRRRRRAIIYGVGGVVLVGGILVGGVATGVISAGALGQSGNFVNILINGRTLAKVKTPDGKVLKLKAPHLRRTRIEYDGSDMSLVLKPRKQEYRFEGEEAQRVAGIVVSRINRAGAARRLDEAPAAPRMARSGIARPGRAAGRAHPPRGGDGASRGTGAQGARRGAVAPGACVGRGGGDRRHLRQPPAPRGDGGLSGAASGRERSLNAAAPLRIRAHDCGVGPLGVELAAHHLTEPPVGPRCLEITGALSAQQGRTILLLDGQHTDHARPPETRLTHLARAWSNGDASARGDSRVCPPLGPGAPMTRVEWVLLVEDEADQRLILSETLARLDGSIEVHEAPDGETAMKWLRSAAGDPARLSGGMVVLDLGLPRASGFQVLEWMRDVPALRNLPAVVLTASENPMDADHAFNLGARGYFQKPRDVREYADIFRRAFHIAQTPARDQGNG